MPDEVPGGLQVGELRSLRLRLLDAAFAEAAKAGGIGFADGFGGESLGDGDEGDVRGVAVGAFGGERDSLCDAVEICGDGNGVVPGRDSSTRETFVFRAYSPFVARPTERVLNWRTHYGRAREIHCHRGN